MPLYIILHGIALTLWYFLFVVQALLVASNRTNVHRKLGVATVVLAGFVVVLSTTVVLRAPARDFAAGETASDISLKVIGDIALLILFSTQILLGILFRKKSDVHKRLMCLASITIVAPAIARLPGAEAALPLSVVVPQLLLFGAIAIYDIVTRRRVHRSTGWGIAAYILLVGISVPLALSETGHNFVQSLK